MNEIKILKQAIKRRRDDVESMLVHKSFEMVELNYDDAKAQQNLAGHI